MALITAPTGSFHNNDVYGEITFDDQTMLIEKFVYHNATAQAAYLVITDNVDNTIRYEDILPANTDRTKNIPASQRPTINEVNIGMNWPYYT